MYNDKMYTSEHSELPKNCIQSITSHSPRKLRTESSKNTVGLDHKTLMRPKEKRDPAPNPADRKKDIKDPASSKSAACTLLQLNDTDMVW